MFGYIKPFKPDMRVREYELYKAVYCSVCKDLGKNFGIISRFLLSYDATFLALVLLSLEKNPCTVYNKRCVVNPFKRCDYISLNNNNSKIFFFVSAITILLSYNKFVDDVADHKGLRKLLARLLKVLYGRAYKKAKISFPKEEKEISEGMVRQSATEKKKASVDEYAHQSALLLSSILGACYTEDNVKFRILSEFGYHLGRWVYFMDAADDREKDKKLHNFNPFASNIQNDEILMILNQTLARIMAAYDLLDVNSVGAILENVISRGLPYMQTYILNNKHKVKRRNNNERSI